MTDLTKLRNELRELHRCDLLIIAERAAELVPRANLAALMGDFMQIDTLIIPNLKPTAPLIAEVRNFYNESRDGRYFDNFDVKSRHFREHSRGTDAFVAEFDRLLHQCVKAVGLQPRDLVREAFEVLFRLLRHIDKAHDDVVYFADEAGSWQLGINWRKVFPVYFRCLAKTVTPEEFARTVDQMIGAFAEHERPLHLKTAHRVAPESYQASLRALGGTDE